MKALHVFCHNVVLVRDENGRRCIVTGKGIGFMKEKGDRINQKMIQYVYVEDNSYKEGKVVKN